MHLATICLMLHAYRQTPCNDFLYHRKVCKHSLCRVPGLCAPGAGQGSLRQAFFRPGMLWRPCIPFLFPPQVYHEEPCFILCYMSTGITQVTLRQASFRPGMLWRPCIPFLFPPQVYHEEPCFILCYMSTGITQVTLRQASFCLILGVRHLATIYYTIVRYILCSLATETGIAASGRSTASIRLGYASWF